MSSMLHCFGHLCIFYLLLVKAFRICAVCMSEKQNVTSLLQLLLLQVTLQYITFTLAESRAFK